MGQPSEAAARIQRLIVTLEEKKVEADRAKADINRATIDYDNKLKALDQTRLQLKIELAKLDPPTFGDGFLDNVSEALRKNAG